MLTAAHERRLLQLAVSLGALVPVLGGAWGVLGRIATPSAASESHVRYLSGLLLGIGLQFWACVPAIERRGVAVGVLGLLVITGGLARLAGAFETGFGRPVVLPLVMELGVTPLIVLWRARVARRLRERQAEPSAI